MPAAVNEHVFIIRANDAVLSYYLYATIRSRAFQQLLKPYIKGIIGGVSREIGNIEIPLPPLEVQRKIVADIEGYEKKIGNYEVEIANCRKKIDNAIEKVWG